MAGPNTPHDAKAESDREKQENDRARAAGRSKATSRDGFVEGDYPRTFVHLTASLPGALVSRTVNSAEEEADLDAQWVHVQALPFETAPEAQVGPLWGGKRWVTVEGEDQGPPLAEKKLGEGAVSMDDPAAPGRLRDVARHTPAARVTAMPALDPHAKADQKRTP